MKNFVTPQKPAGRSEDIHRLFITVRDVSRALSIQENTIRNRIYLGTWPVGHVKIGNKILFPLVAHQAYVAELLERAGQPAIRPAPPVRGKPRAAA